MLRFYTKKLAIIYNISIFVINNRKDKKKTSIQDLEIIKHII